MTGDALAMAPVCDGDGRASREHADAPVGELIRKELEARGWSQATFASILDRPTQFVSEIVTGKKELTRESASQIAAALGHTAEQWRRLQDRQLLAVLAQNPVVQAKLEGVRRRAALHDKEPEALRLSSTDTTGEAP